jgi:peptidoglycan/LPS O-acetylase OafA/YrhL
MFVAGILLYELLGWESLKPHLTRAGEVVASVIFLASFPAMYMIDTRLALGEALAPTEGLQTTQRVVLMFGAFFVFGVFCFGFDGRLRATFSWDPLRWLGNMSYSYYLVHGATLQAVAAAVRLAGPAAQWPGYSYWAAMLACFVFTLLAASVLFLTVEKPLSLDARRTAREVRVRRQVAA